MEIIDVDDFKEKDFNGLYNFINKKDNLSNKNIKNNLLWNIIYLRKAFRNSENYYKRSSKFKTLFHYVIFVNNEIKAVIAISSETRIPIKLFDLSIVWDKSFLEQLIKSNTSNTIISNIIAKFNNNFKTENYLINCYVDSRQTELNEFMENNNFKLACVDTQTFVYKNNIYYNLLINDEANNVSKLTVSSVVKLLMDYYNLDNMVEPVILESPLKRKLTKKELAIGKTDKSKTLKRKSDIIQIPKSISEFKIITKNIFDVKEIIDLPEYNYDYVKMLSLKTYENIFLTFYNMTDDNIIKTRYFREPNIYNNSLYDIYYNILQNSKKYIKLSSNKLLPLIKNLIKYKVGEYFVRYFKASMTNKILEKNVNKLLVISNSDNEIINNIALQNDNIYIKHITINKIQDIINLIQKKTSEKNNISFTTSFEDLNTIINNTNKKYDIVYLNNTYLNYDFLLSSIHLIIKLPFLLNTILNALKVISKGGKLYITLFIGNSINIPSLKKLFGFILEQFETYEIIEFQELHFMIIKFINFNDNIDYKYIDLLLSNILQYENNEYELEDVIKCLETNKFYYKINSNDGYNHKLNHKLSKKIIYDIPALQINKTTKLNKFITEYNNITKNYNNYFNKVYNKVYLNNNNKTHNIIENFINYNITCIFYNSLKYNTINNADVELYIDKIIKKYKSFENYRKSYISSLI